MVLYNFDQATIFSAASSLSNNSTLHLHTLRKICNILLLNYRALMTRYAIGDRGEIIVYFDIKLQQQRKNVIQ